MNFFAFIRETLSDPADKQGSTKRLVLLLFMLMLVTLIIIVTVVQMKLPEIPSGLLNLIYAVLGSTMGLMTADKAIAAYKSVNGTSDSPPA
jgi:hypothetical protein